MTKTKTTKKEYFEQIIALAEAAGKQEIVEFAQKEIDALAAKAAKAKERAAEKKAADTLTEDVYAALTDVFEPIAEIAARVDGEDVTASKVSYRLRTLVADGRAEKGELTLGGDGEKKRKVVAYKLA